MVRRALTQTISNPSNLHTWYAGHINPDRKRVFLAAAPKSGSTFLSKLLGEIFPWPMRDACGSWGFLEQQIYPPRLIPFVDQDGIVGNQHMKGSPESIEWLNLFGFQTVIMVRDFSDTVVSLRDHHLNSGVEGSMGFLTIEMLADMSESEHIDYIITEMMPWYAAFVASWQYFAKKLDRPPIWINFRELLPTPHAAIIRVADSLSVSLDATKIDQAISQTSAQQIRFNVGREGRGREVLNVSQHAALESVVMPYLRSFDFSEVWSA